MNEIINEFFLLLSRFSDVGKFFFIMTTISYIPFLNSLILIKAGKILQKKQTLAYFWKYIFITSLIISVIDYNFI